MNVPSRAACRSQVILSLLAVLAIPALARAEERPDVPTPETRAVLDRFGRAQAGFDALAADVVGTRVPEDGGAPSALAGRITYAKPGRIRWDFTAPDARSYVLDGGQLTGWVPAKKEVEQLDLKRVEGRFRRLLVIGQDAKALARDFRVSLASDPGKGDGAADDELVFVPKSRHARQRIREVRVDVNRRTGLADAIRYDVPGHGTIRFELRNVKVNPELSADTFRLKTPAGAKVVQGVSSLAFAAGGVPDNGADDEGSR